MNVKNDKFKEVFICFDIALKIKTWHLNECVKHLLTLKLYFLSNTVNVLSLMTFKVEFKVIR